MSEEARLIEAIDHAARRIVAAKYVTALTGAGLSVESGIPSFRGPWADCGRSTANRTVGATKRFLEDPKSWWEQRLKGVETMPEMRALDNACSTQGTTR